MALDGAWIPLAGTIVGHLEVAGQLFVDGTCWRSVPRLGNTVKDVRVGCEKYFISTWVS